MPIDQKNIAEELKKFEFPDSAQRPPKKEKEHIAEQSAEKQPAEKMETVVSESFAKEGLGPESAPVQASLPQIKIPHYAEVETILEDSLMELYKGLPQVKKAEFKAKGEQTVKQIAVLLNTTKISFFDLSKKIFSLIINWLKIIPGVNKYFLEQEAKIKSDKILALRNNKDQPH